MAIKKFSFVDQAGGWTLNETTFGDFNLLVGVSGVGKSKILQALSSIKWAGLLNASQVAGCKWSLELQIQGGATYHWRAQTSSLSAEMLHSVFYDTNGNHNQLSRYLEEHLIKDDGQVLIQRKDDQFVFQNKLLPKLKAEESAISLLANEPSIAPFHKALQRILFTEARYPTPVEYDVVRLENLRQQLDSYTKLQSATSVPLLARAFVLQKDYPEMFQRIINRYQDIFEKVEDVKVDRLSELKSTAIMSNQRVDQEQLAIGVKEHGVSGWIVSPVLSHGMFQTLILLIELELAPAETIFLIDEIENGLGVNCLPQLMDQFLVRSRDLQFIITSHHPYVINNIPTEYWKIVTRQGSTVSVMSANAVPELQTKSAHEKFILLLNSQAYEEGIR